MKISKSKLQEALEKTKPALANKDIIEQSSSFIFMNGRIHTYNDEISISCPVDDVDLKGAIKSQLLYEFLQKTSKDEIVLRQEQSEIVLMAGKAKAGFTFEHEIFLPINLELSSSNNWKDVPANFNEGLALCYPCCSSDMSQPNLTCVHVHDTFIEATDGFQIVRFELDSSVIESFLIPKAAAGQLVKYKPTKMLMTDGWAHFKTEDDTIFSARTFAGTFPNIDKHLEISKTSQRINFPKRIKDILERARIFSNRADTISYITTAQLTLHKNELVIQSKNAYGWFEEKSKIRYDGKKFSFMLGLDSALAILPKMRLCNLEENKISFNGENWQHVIAVTTHEDK